MQNFAWLRCNERLAVPSSSLQVLKIRFKSSQTRSKVQTTKFRWRHVRQLNENSPVNFTIAFKLLVVLIHDLIQN